MLLFSGCSANLNRLVNRGVGWNGYPSLTSKFCIVLFVAMAMETLCLGSPVDSVLIWSLIKRLYLCGALLKTSKMGKNRLWKLLKEMTPIFVVYARGWKLEPWSLGCRRFCWRGKR